MRQEPKKRIETNAPQSPLAGLGDAFANLKMPDLPEAPAHSSAGQARAVEPLWKPGRVVLRKETAHRGGKAVIVVDDFPTHLPASFIEGLAKKLRAACGCGGTVKARRIELQGDHPAKVRALLEAEGFQVAGIK